MIVNGHFLKRSSKRIGMVDLKKLHLAGFDFECFQFAALNSFIFILTDTDFLIFLQPKYLVLVKLDLLASLVSLPSR